MNTTRISLLFKAMAFVVIASMLLAGSGMPVSAQGSSVQTVAELMEPCLAGSTNYTTSPLSGAVDSVEAVDGIAVGKRAGITSYASPEQAARGYMATCGPVFGLTKGAELRVRRQSAAELGRTVVKFQQAYQGVPVFAGEVNVEVNAKQDVVMVNGTMLPDIAINTTPRLSAAAAQKAALKSLGNAGTVTTPELWIYNPKLVENEGATALVWRMEVSQDGPPPVWQLVLVNAQDGTIALSLNQLDTALKRNTYNMHNGTSYGASTIVCGTTNPTCVGGDNDAKKAHIYGGDTYNFYWNHFHRDSINNAGMMIKSYVHYWSSYCNAYWNGSVMTYGDGCSIVADDVVGHEITHGVTQYESGLIYQNQSGAINESLSDIFGEWIDQTNGRGNDSAAVKWLVGEDTTGGSWGNGALRNMKNPPAAPGYQPDRMGSSLYYHGSSDHGGVHTNSGVGNKAAYLITDGGSFNGQVVAGLGLTKAARIFYKVQKDILTSNATYANLGNALSTACNLLRGTSGITTANCDNVRKATKATQMVSSAPPSGGKPKAGYWKGYAHEFYVTSAQNAVINFAVTVSVYGCGTYKITHITSTPISNMNFAYTGAFYVNGHFSSTSTANVTDGLSHFYISGCGYVSGGPWKYPLSWQHTFAPVTLDGALGQDNLVQKLQNPVPDYVIVTKVDK